jgi:hypothetical protein
VELQPEWNEFLRLLKRHGVRFVMVGGLAVSVHGHARYTKDLDVLVDPTEANARRLGKALVEFGFTATGRAWRHFARPYQILTLGVEPVRIDVLTSISGVSFRGVWKARHMLSTSAGEIPVIGLAELRANKLATGRAQDLADVIRLDELERARLATQRPRSGRQKPATPAAGHRRSRRRR